MHGNARCSAQIIDLTHDSRASLLGRGSSSNSAYYCLTIASAIKLCKLPILLVMQGQRAASGSLAAHCSGKGEGSMVAHSRRCNLIVALLATAAFVRPEVLRAQDAARQATDDPNRRDEIIVTAQKRSEALQRVPISIQALDTKRLEQLQITRFEDYVRYLPSVSYSTSSIGSPGNTSVSFRGIATDAGLIPSATLPTVGFYLDEQPVTSIIGTADVHIYDVARIEALAGPQGTLYGASSEAGTIRIVTNKPNSGKFIAGYDLELNKILSHGTGGSAEGFVNLPIAKDVAALRVVGWYNRTGGYIDNVLRSRTFRSSGIVQTNNATVGNDLNKVDTYGLRAQLGIDLNDSWTVTPSVMAQKSRWHGSFQSDDDKVGELKTAHFFPEFGTDKWIQAGGTITGKVSDFDVTYAGYYMSRHRTDQNDYADYGFFYDLVNGSGAGVVNNAGNLIDPSQLSIINQKLDKVSQEFRVASPQDRPIRAIAGLFYQRQKLRDENDYLTPGFADALSVPGRPGQVWLTLQQRIDRDYAVFGQADFDLSKHLTLTGGLRAYRFDNSLVGFYGVNTTYFGIGVRQCLGRSAGGGPYGLGPAVVSGTPCTNLGILNADGSISPKRSKGTGITWRANATYKFNDDHLAWATVSTGFRPGGINRAGNADPFDADKLYNYEIGTKNSFFDRRLNLNFVGFLEKWDKVQVTYQPPGGNGVALIANAGGARSIGVEGDFRYRQGGFTLSGSATYLNAKLTKPLFTGGTIPTADKGTKLPLTPSFKANLIARYEAPVGAYTAYGQLAAAYLGKRNSVIVTADEKKTGALPAYTTLDATIGARRGDWTAEIFVRNITDARGQQSRAARCNVNICGPSSADPVGEIYRIYIQPRTVGVRFGQRF